MVYVAQVTVCSEINTERIQCGQNVELLNVELVVHQYIYIYMCVCVCVCVCYVYMLCTKT
jgi:hypothetical protein